MQFIDHSVLNSRIFDVVIVGGGFSGAILAKALGDQGKSILILEAGEGSSEKAEKFFSFLNNFYTTTAKVPNSPFPSSPNAPQPMETDVRPIKGNKPSTVGYFVQAGPLPFESTYTRRLGGTSLHWFGSCPRMLPEDFRLYSQYGVGRDWPLSYDELIPYYAMAEEEIGVSAEVLEQSYAGMTFAPDYVYPMHKIPISYLDLWMGKKLDGYIDYSEENNPVPINVVSIPQARNSIPNKDYNNGRGYKPEGAVFSPTLGQRCMGNSSCIPICPIQARYSALKTLERTKGKEVFILPKAVASEIQINPDNGRVTGIFCKVWKDDSSSEHIKVIAKGKIYVAAAHAIENAILLLASNIANRSGLLGANLMDHPAILSWGLSPESIGAFRGPGLTSTIPAYRSGEGRRKRAAFVFEIGNWGWSWPKNEPVDSVVNFVDEKKLYGQKLRQKLANTLPKQIRVDLMTEQLPSLLNKVSIDNRYKDQLGNYRPVINYSVDEYTKQGLIFGRAFSKRIFQHTGIKDFTSYSKDDPGYFEYKDESYSWSGVGHIAGTHLMGRNASDSVVDHRQKSWEHENLYIVGCGSFPTLGTSNPTLTMTALNFRTSEYIKQDLEK